MGDRHDIVHLIPYPKKFISGTTQTKNPPTGAQQDSEARLILVYNELIMETVDISYILPLNIL